MNKEKDANGEERPLLLFYGRDLKSLSVWMFCLFLAGLGLVAGSTYILDDVWSNLCLVLGGIFVGMGAVLLVIVDLMVKRLRSRLDKVSE